LGRIFLLFMIAINVCSVVDGGTLRGGSSHSVPSGLPRCATYAIYDERMPLSDMDISVSVVPVWAMRGRNSGLALAVACGERRGGGVPFCWILRRFFGYRC
jgi:hypothetical protein